MIQKLIHDWNKTAMQEGDRKLILHDETLRDGLQSPSVNIPDITGKKEILHHLVELGIHSVDLGMPAASAKEFSDVRALMMEIRDHHLPIRPVVAVRTLTADLARVAELQQQVGIAVEAAAFLGSSSIRMNVENWDLALLVDRVRKTGNFCREHEIDLALVTEDTTRAQPETLTAIYSTALEEGAIAICLADTCGHATPRGVKALTRFIRETILKDNSIRLDWHGHNDRGFGLANAIAAFEAGADCLHGTLMGIGERCGNVALDQLLINLTLMGCWKKQLDSLNVAMKRASELLNISIPVLYPAFGKDAFRTGTGIHAAAIAKALLRDDKALADSVYSGVPATLVGRRQEIEIGPVAGRSNVEFWLQANGYEEKAEYIERILQHAKQGNRILDDSEIKALLDTCSEAFQIL